MSYGVLIGQNAVDTTVLTKYEYETALQAVRLARSEEREEGSIAYAIHLLADDPQMT